MKMTAIEMEVMERFDDGALGPNKNDTDLITQLLKLHSPDHQHTTQLISPYFPWCIFCIPEFFQIIFFFQGIHAGPKPKMPISHHLPIFC